MQTGARVEQVPLDRAGGHPKAAGNLLNRHVGEIVQHDDLLVTLGERLDEHPDLGLRVQWEPGASVPERFEGLAQNVLAEAVRNARKHAQATAIDIGLAQEQDALILQIVNDGARAPGEHSGMGLQLAALEALHNGALVEFGPEGSGRWRVRLVMPLELS